MTSESKEMTTYNRMRKALLRLSIFAIAGSAVSLAISLLMFKLGVQPSGELESYRWLIAHQEQLLAEQSGRFYWGEAFTGTLLGILSAVLFVVGLVSVNLLVIVKIARITASAVFAESKIDPKN